MKRIFYLSGTLFFLSLTLLVGFHLGVTSVEGKPNKSGKRGVVFWSGGLGVTETGEVWSLGSACNWTRQLGDEPLPIPVSEIAIDNPPWIISKSGDGWRELSGIWQNCGPVPTQ